MKLEISRTGTPSLRNSSAVPPVEIISTPCFSSARAKEAIPFLFETEMRARVIFKEARCWPKDFSASPRNFVGSATSYFFSFHFKTTPCITPPISRSFSLLCTMSARVKPVMA